MCFNAVDAMCAIVMPIQAFMQIHTGGFTLAEGAHSHRQQHHIKSPNAFTSLYVRGPLEGFANITEGMLLRYALCLACASRHS